MTRALTMGSIEEFHKQIWGVLGPVDDVAFEAIAARAPTAAEIQAVEAALDVPLPAEFIAFSGKSNGLLIEARDTYWPEPLEGSVGSAWTFWRGVLLLGFPTDDLPAWASLLTALEQLHADGVEGVAPVFKVLGDGERIWGVDGNGASVLVCDGEVEILDASLVDLYAEQVQELVERQKKIARRRT